jgi:hypothetical protein
MKEIKKMAESVDGKLLDEFWKLIGFCEAFAGYNPPNPLLETAQMKAQHAAGVAAVEAISTNLAPFKVATNERQQAYEGIAEYGVRIRNMAKASGASQQMLDDMLTYTRKLRGSRAGTAPVDNPDTPENEALNKHSVSQTSYVARLEHFRNVANLAKNEPLYQSNEADLKTSAFDDYVANLETNNANVAAKFVPLSNSRATRDALLYYNADSIVDVALLVKAYVAGAFGKNSTLYQQIKNLKFKRPKK